MIRKATAVTTSLLLALTLGATLAGCGEKEEPVENPSVTTPEGLNLLLDWTPNPNHAGIYTGIEKGRFADRALRVKPQVPTDPAAVIQQVASGRADVGISYQSEVLAARDKGAKVKAVASLVGTPLNSLIWLKKSGIDSVKDLEGKRIGYSGAYTEAYLKTILEKNGVDPAKVKQTNLGYDSLPNLIAGNVDAVTDVYWNVEGVQLKERKRKATVTPLDKLGVPKYYELVVIAGEQALADGKKSDKIRRFLAGLAEGTADAVADPTLAAKVVYEADKAQNKKFVADSVKVTLPVLVDEDATKPYGYIDESTWQSFANWMRDNGLLKNPPEPGAAYDNGLLPPVKTG
jgi:putative hydroxymethylpyrimidine transport system substrate-binding protein